MTETKKKIGRPKLPKNEARAVFSVRVSALEKREIEAAAKKAKKPLTQWARETLLSAAR
jgi:predicted HicB family RNase H-like nuclease